MPHYIAIGCTKQEFLHSTPRMLKVYDKAFQKKQEIIDERMYIQGLYVFKAFSVVIDHFGAGLSGKKNCTSEYFEMPLLQDKKRRNADGTFTEEELSRQRKEFADKMRKWGEAFSASH